MKKSLLALSFGTLGLGIAEFVMMSILPDVAIDLCVSIPTAGHLISAYALGVCVGAPLTVFIARTRPLKQILLGLITLFIIGHLLTAASPTFGTMLLMRFIAGLPHGAYFGVGSIIADRVADKGKSAQAIAVMVAGMTVANLIGIPLGTFLSHAFSWRIIFLLTGLWGIFTCYAIYKWVPFMEPLPNTGLKGQFRFLKNPAPWLVICATMFGNGGVFSWYSYITPLMTEVAGFMPSAMSLLMVLAGAGMCVGNLLGGHFSDKYQPGIVAATTQCLICLTLLSIFFLAPLTYLTAVLMCVCTLCLFALSSPQQLLLLKNAEGGEMMGAACVQIAFNLGNAFGAYCGGLPLEAGLGYEYPALIGSGLSFLGFLSLALYSYRYERQLLKTNKLNQA